MINPETMKTPILSKIFQRVKECENIDYACAAYTVEALNEIEFKDIPPKTKEVIEYEKIPRETRRNFNSGYFKEVAPNVIPYYALVDVVKRENGAIYEWIISCMKILRDKPEDVKKLHAKIEPITVEQVWVTPR